jgi:hypothetical protein
MVLEAVVDGLDEAPRHAVTTTERSRLVGSQPNEW